MQIGGVEIACAAQRLYIGDEECPAAEFDQPILAQALKGAIDVDGRQARRIGKLLLGDWQLQLVVLGQPDVSFAGGVR